VGHHLLTGGTSYPAVSFTGTPTTLGTYNVQVTLQDAVGATVSGTYALTITQTIPNIITVAGNGGQGYNGDNIAATSSSLNSPWGVAVDGSGNVFFADTSNNRVREIVKATGNVVTVAGNGTAGFTGDGGQASAAELNLPYGVTLDGNGNLFIGDYGGHIRKVVLATGIITTVAGNGTYSFSGDGGPATSAGLFDPFGVAVDSSGNLYIADYANERIREVSAATGIITTIAGNGTQGYSGDGGPATSAELSGPLGLAVDPSGNVFIADTYNNRIREVVKATGNIITVAGTGVGGYNGDGPAASTEIYGPGMLALDGSGNLFFADNQNQRIRELVKATGQIVTVAGVGGISGFSGDNGPALAAKLAFPKGVALDANGNLYFADQNNGRIREVLSGILGSLSSTAWTVNQPGFSGTIPIVNTAPPPGSVVSATGLPAGLSASLSGSTITITGTPTAPGTYGNVTISLLDVSGSTIASCTYTMTINAAPALGTLGGPTQWTVGQAGYAGTIPTGGGTGALTVSSQANMPPGLSAVVTGSLVTFTGTPTTVGTYSNIQLTVQDTTGATSTGTYSITINPAAASALTITGLPLTVTRGAAQTFTVSSKDPYGNTATGYSGTLHFSSSDPQAVLPPDTTLNGGTGTFQVVFASLGTGSLSVTDTSNSALTATQGGITVNPAPAVRLAVTGFPSSSTAGVAATFSVAAIDAYGYVATGYTGTVHFTSSDPQAVLPADVSLTNGTGSFSATLKTAGTQSLTATDTANASLNGTEGSITVAPAAATTLSLAGFPTSITAGVSGTATVTARDAYGNVATGYTGTVHVSSSDSRASLPADYTFTMADAGVHTFAVILKTAGPQTVTFQDAQHGFTATAGISVTAAAASQFVLSGFPSATTAGLVQNLTLTALDAYGNIATGYTGAVHFTSSDHQAVLPADYSFSSSDNGVHTFSASLCTAGTQSLTATDTATATLTASQTGISVVAGTVSKFIVGGYPATTAGTSHSFTVTATDAYGNVVIGYRGTVHFTSSDVQAGLPANYTFTATDNGVHTFSATLKTAGTQSLTVTDTATPSITGSQAGISVTAAAATHLAITAPANVSIGVAFSVTVTALDAYGNIATGYLGTIHFTSSDNKAILPNNYTFVAGDAGVHTFTVTFKSSGTQTLTATDTHTGSIKGSASVKVS
jgi:hypothetical protein